MTSGILRLSQFRCVALMYAEFLGLVFLFVFLHGIVYLHVSLSIYSVSCCISYVGSPTFTTGPRAQSSGILETI